MTFTSQYGTISVASLPVVSDRRRDPAGRPESRRRRSPTPQGPGPAQESDIFATIERLADLQKKGILSPEEFAAKKSELLGRL